MGFREQYILREKQRRYAEMADEAYRNHVANAYATATALRDGIRIGDLLSSSDAKFDKQIDGEVVR